MREEFAHFNRFQMSDVLIWFLVLAFYFIYFLSYLLVVK